MLKILSFLAEYSGRYISSDPTGTLHPASETARPEHIPLLGVEGRLAFRCCLSHWAAPDLKIEHKPSVKRA
ncbi:hypothetical protein NGR_c19350 [Sinorhizobium fredii NGR234]|uniref:Uncharacterized protein n=1 Tax=Sinorhizobium fredii (strain NBRC 101917 / NGR234) TaxID=394 RepID=C3ME29_SINFN|nr:hypothetical protein NGR_c19350 [Sinorhizobium fredii NGR234]